MSNQMAQGDLLVVKIDAIPEGFVESKRDAYGRLVVADGEATGHRHVVRQPNVCMLVREGISDKVLSIGDDFIELMHDQGDESYVSTGDHDPVTIQGPGNFCVIRQREWVGQGVQRVED
jgi:hypothetical protein